MASAPDSMMIDIKTIEETAAAELAAAQNAAEAAARAAAQAAQAAAAAKAAQAAAAARLTALKQQAAAQQALQQQLIAQQRAMPAAATPHELETVNTSVARLEKLASMHDILCVATSTPLQTPTQQQLPQAHIMTRQALDDLIRSGTSLLPSIKQLTEFAPSQAIYLKTEGLDSFIDNPSPAASESNQPVVAGGATPPCASSSFTSADRELLSLMNALEQKAKVIATNTNHVFRDAAVRLTQVLSASGQLGGWKHVEEFMTDQEAYSRKKGQNATVRGANHAGANSLSTDGMEKSKIDRLSDSAENILRDAMTRAKWVLEIERNHTPRDSKILNRILGVLFRDSTWMTESATFLKNAEQQVSALINMNPALFAKFREMQSRGVQWPHSPHLRRVIERAGFVFRPMMIKRDRCVCDACGVEVSGWRQWHNPWLFHDWTKRHPFEAPPGSFLDPRHAAERDKADREYCHGGSMVPIASTAAAVTTGTAVQSVAAAATTTSTPASATTSSNGFLTATAAVLSAPAGSQAPSVDATDPLAAVPGYQFMLSIPRA